MICLSTCLKDDNEVISGKLPLNAACPWQRYQGLFAYPLLLVDLPIERQTLYEIVLALYYFR
jgi:hypothetical protein